MGLKNMVHLRGNKIGNDDIAKKIGNEDIVKGEKADPLKVLERIKKKSHRQVELISPIPKPLEEPKKPQEKEVMIKSEEKKEEPPHVITVVLGVYMHCEACAQEIKKRIQRMKGVESAEPTLKITTNRERCFRTGILIEYVHKRTGKHASIVATEEGKEEEERVLLKAKNRRRKWKKEQKIMCYYCFVYLLLIQMLEQW